MLRFGERTVLLCSFTIDVEICSFHALTSESRAREWVKAVTEFVCKVFLTTTPELPQEAVMNCLVGVPRRSLFPFFFT